MNPFMIIIKALAKYGGTAVKGLLKAGKGFLKATKKFPGKNIKNNAKGLHKKLKLKGSEDNPSLLDVGKRELKQKLTSSINDFKDRIKTKGVAGIIKDKAVGAFDKIFNINAGEILEKHRITKKMLDAGVPLSTIVKMQKDGEFTKEGLRSKYKELVDKRKKNEISDKDRRAEIIRDAKLELKSRRKLRTEEPKYQDPRIIKEKLSNLDASELKDIQSIKDKLARDIKKDPANASEFTRLAEKEIDNLKYKNDKIRAVLNNNLDELMLNNALSPFTASISNAIMNQLVESDSITDENLKLVASSILASTSKLTELNAENTRTDLSELSAYIKESDLLTNDHLNKVKELVLDVSKNGIELSGKSSDHLLEQLQTLQNTIVDDIVENAKRDKEADDQLINSIKDIIINQDEKEAEIKKRRDESDAKTSSEESETDKQAKLGTLNILKSQNTIVDLITNNKKSPGEINGIMEGALKATVKSLGEDVGFYGTAVASALKSIPDMVAQGLSVITEPLNKINIPNPIHYLGKAFAGMKSEEDALPFDKRHPKIASIPGIGWLAEKLDSFGGFIGNKLGGVGDWMLGQAPDPSVPLGTAITTAVTYIPNKIGDLLSYGILKVMGLPDDLLDEKERSKTPGPASLDSVTNRGTTRKLDINRDNNANKMVTSNINSVTTGAINSITSESTERDATINRIDLITKENFTEKILRPAEYEEDEDAYYIRKRSLELGLDPIDYEGMTIEEFDSMIIEKELGNKTQDANKLLVNSYVQTMKDDGGEVITSAINRLISSAPPSMDELNKEKDDKLDELIRIQKTNQETTNNKVEVLPTVHTKSHTETRVVDNSDAIFATGNGV